jgi:phospholipid/cholesterol/gamma-HCH transport system substrate-binding protein
VEDRLHVKVGAAVLITLVAAVALVVGLGGRHVTPGFRAHVEMERSGPIQEGTAVKLAGRTIGEVQGIRMSRTGVVLDLWIQRRWRQHLLQNSDVFINQATVFGEAYVEIGPPRGGEPGPPLEDGGTVRGADPPRLDRLLLKSYQNLEAVSALLREGVPEAMELANAVRELSKTLDAVEPDAGAYGRTFAAGAQLFAEGALMLDALRKSGTTYDEVKRTATRARALFARSRRDLTALGEKLDRLTAHLEPLRSRLTPERLARFTEAIDRTRILLADVDRLLADVDSLTALVENGEGTIGAFLKDEEIADDMKQLMKLLKSRPWMTVGHPQ